MLHKTTTFLMILAASFAFAGNKPLGITFKEDLRFGGEEEELEYEWLDNQLACDFQVDSRGHIYVVDQRTVSILEFDENGKFLRTVAQKGQGPGEFQTVAVFKVMPDDTAVGLDFLGGAYKAHYYKKGLEFDQSKNIPNLFGFMFKADFNDQVCLLQMIKFGNGAQHMTMDVTDRNLQNPVNWARADWPPQLTDPGDPNQWIKYLGGQFKGFWNVAHLTAGFLEDGRIVKYDASKGIAEIHSADHKKLLKKLDVGVRPLPFTEAEQDQLVEAITTILFKQTGPGIQQIVTPAVIQKAIDFADLPKVQSPAFDVFSIKGDLFGVVTKVNWATGEFGFDLIDANKGYLGHVKFPERGVFSIFGTRLRFKDGKAYAMGWNEDDSNQMVRFQVNGL